MGDTHALFESTHGSAPDIAGQNKANPTAMFLTMIMMLNRMGWGEAAERIVKGINEALEHHEMTGDLARHIPGTKPLSTSDYTEAVIHRMTGTRLEKTA